jgi:hypothetical protein
MRDRLTSLPEHASLATVERDDVAHSLDAHGRRLAEAMGTEALECATVCERTKSQDRGARGRGLRARPR